VVTSSTYLYVQRYEEVSSEVRSPTCSFPFTDKAFTKFSRIRDILFSSALKIRDGGYNAFQSAQFIEMKRTINLWLTAAESFVWTCCLSTT
jgi:hypothetical protein